MSIMFIRSSDGYPLYVYKTPFVGVFAHSVLYDSSGYYYMALNNDYILVKFKEGELNYIWDRALPGRLSFTLTFGKDTSRLVIGGRNCCNK